MNTNEEALRTSFFLAPDLTLEEAYQTLSEERKGQILEALDYQRLGRLILAKWLPRTQQYPEALNAIRVATDFALGKASTFILKDSAEAVPRLIQGTGDGTTARTRGSAEHFNAYAVLRLCEVPFPFHFYCSSCNLGQYKPFVINQIRLEEELLREYFPQAE